ncbi:MAG: Flp family type IVb pilin [Hyphomicrobiales bacterium]|nr:Flp family type IVb pilin [Hyphomicrobiales bacterium]
MLTFPEVVAGIFLAMNGEGSLIRRFLRDERGITSIEYALIASIISICAVASLGVIGTRVNGMFNGILPGLN